MGEMTSDIPYAGQTSDLQSTKQKIVKLQQLNETEFNEQINSSIYLNFVGVRNVTVN